MSVAGPFLQEVCSQYWPETGGVTTFGEYTIDHLEEESSPGFVIRQLRVQAKKVCFCRASWGSFKRGGGDICSVLPTRCTPD